MNHRTSALAGILICIALSCSKTNEQALSVTTPSGCDTTNRTYANVVAVLQTHCYVCHGAASNTGSGGIVLEGYSNLQAKAAGGVLLGVITHAAGFPAMPLNQPKLSDCEINTIRSWINNGAQNN